MLCLSSMSTACSKRKKSFHSLYFRSLLVVNQSNCNNIKLSTRIGRLRMFDYIQGFMDSHLIFMTNVQTHFLKRLSEKRESLKLFKIKRESNWQNKYNYKSRLQDTLYFRTLITTVKPHVSNHPKCLV